MMEEEIERLRGVVRDCVSKHLYSSAIFFADKVAAASSDPTDIYMQAQSLFLGRHHRRAHHLLISSRIVLLDLRFRYLAAKCLGELKEWHQCLLMLGDAKVDEGQVHAQLDCSSMHLDKDVGDHEINITSAICFLQGKAYEALENHAQARQCKATSVDGTFPREWIGAGNTYAAYQESDQAMSAYRAAARLFPGCHLPTLYIGMEYMRTHNFKLAKQARGICPSDPLVYNELGVVAYHMKEYEKAAQWFEAALNHVATYLSEMWKPTLVNLAHSQRKLKKYQEAITNYKKALDLSSQSLNTFTGLAYTYHLQALWLKPNDQLCTEMLTLVLQDGCEGYDLWTNGRMSYIFLSM